MSDALRESKKTQAGRTERDESSRTTDTLKSPFFFSWLCNYLFFLVDNRKRGG